MAINEHTNNSNHRYSSYYYVNGGKEEEHKAHALGMKNEICLMSIMSRCGEGMRI